MRSSEFLNEAGRDGAAPMTDAEFAAQQAQGAKNWDSIKSVGRKIAGALGGGAQAATPYPDAATARASLTPSQLKWLGGADPMDKYIMARMPAALPGETVAAAPAAAPAPPAAPASNVAQNAATASQLGDKTPAAPAAPAATPVADAVAASGEPDNVTGVDAAVAANAAQATTPPGKATPVSDPKVLALQKQLIAAGAKITADGRMGPATRAAQKQFGGNVTDANQSSAETARLARANTGAATAVANQSSAETARLNRSGAVPAATSPRPSVGLASQLEWDRQYAKTHNANGTPMGAQAATPAAGVPPRPSVGLASQLEWDRQYAKKSKAPSTAPVAMGAANADRRDFEESVSRMRRLSTLLKG